MAAAIVRLDNVERQLAANDRSVGMDGVNPFDDAAASILQNSGQDKK